MRERNREFTKKTKREAKAAQRCALCGADGHLEVHHKVPISQGGGREPENAIALDEHCHRYIDTLTIKYNIPYDLVVGQEYIIGLPKQTKKRRR